MSFLYYFLLFMFAGPLIRNLNYYYPGLGSIVYMAFIVYIFYTINLKARRPKSRRAKRGNVAEAFF